MNPELIEAIAAHRKRRPLELTTEEHLEYLDGQQRTMLKTKELLQVAEECGIKVKVTLTFPNVVGANK